MNYDDGVLYLIMCFMWLNKINLGVNLGFNHLGIPQNVGIVVQINLLQIKFFI